MPAVPAAPVPVRRPAVPHRVRRGALALLALTLPLAACASRGGSGTEVKSTITTTSQRTTSVRAVLRESWGTLPDGRAVDLYTLRNANGIEAKVSNYGAIITHLRTPDRQGRVADIVLGYDSLAGYLKDTPYFGAVVGRFGNRIARGRFALEGRSYTLAVNNGPNHLHGGLKGFDKVVWTAEPFAEATASGLRLRYTSPDGEEGYPGTLRTTVTYTLNDRNELVVDYEATTDKATPVNLTQHSYWNLSGDARRDILAHQLQLSASRFTPVDSTLIPTGQLAPVEGTPFDFRRATAVGARIGQRDTQLRYGGGYDHNFVLDRRGVAAGALAPAARVVDPGTGRTLTIRTTEPGIQFYSGNFLDGTIVGKGGVRYNHRWAIVLETQHFPDSPNQPNFPTTILRPGETYRTRTVFEFGTTR